MLEQCINLTPNLSLQREVKSMQIHVSKASLVTLTNPTTAFLEVCADNLDVRLSCQCHKQSWVAI
jgi:hypothetical protein